MATPYRTHLPYRYAMTYRGVPRVALPKIDITASEKKFDSLNTTPECRCELGETRRSAEVSVTKTST